MEDYLGESVEKYVELATAAEGEPVKLYMVRTSFLPEDHRLAPAGRPCADDPHIECPFCMHTCPEATHLQAKELRESNCDLSPAKKPKPPAYPEKCTPLDHGRLQSITASVLMKVLYVARVARYDLLRPTCRLACYISKWDVYCNKKLHRLISYINSTNICVW